MKQDEKVKEKYLERVNHDSKVMYSWDKIVIELNNSPLGRLSGSGKLGSSDYWNCSHDKCNQKTKEERQKSIGVIHNLEDWENMVEFRYTIRNTLFHGGKNANDRRDFLLVEHGYKTLSPLVEVFINLSL